MGAKNSRNRDPPRPDRGGYGQATFNVVSPEEVEARKANIDMCEAQLRPLIEEAVSACLRFQEEGKNARVDFETYVDAMATRAAIDTILHSCPSLVDPKSDPSFDRIKKLHHNATRSMMKPAYKIKDTCRHLNKSEDELRSILLGNCETYVSSGFPYIFSDLQPENKHDYDWVPAYKTHLGADKRMLEFIIENGLVNCDTCSDEE
jgi:hypothetical protein